MAYEKQTWECGDVITAEKMNHMEDGIAGGDPGYDYSKETVVLTDEVVTTRGRVGMPFSMGEFAYGDLIGAEKIKVTLDGTEYESERTYRASPESYVYEIGTLGSIESFTNQTPVNMLVLNGEDSVGDHSVKIETTKETITVSEGFKKAVESANSETESEFVYVHLTESGGQYSMSESYTGQNLIEMLDENAKTIIGVLSLNESKICSVFSGVYRSSNGTIDGFSFGFVITDNPSTVGVLRLMVDKDTNSISKMTSKSINYDNQ